MRLTFTSHKALKGETSLLYARLLFKYPIQWNYIYKAVEWFSNWCCLNRQNSKKKKLSICMLFVKRFKPDTSVSLVYESMVKISNIFLNGLDLHNIKISRVHVFVIVEAKSTSWYTFATLRRKVCSKSAALFWYIRFSSSSIDGLGKNRTLT